MVKLGLEIKENDNKVNIKLTDPTKKQLEEATELEKYVAQCFKQLFDDRLVELLNGYLQTENEE